VGRLDSVDPPAATTGGRIAISGAGFGVDAVPEVRVGGVAARVAAARPSRLTVIVPADLAGGPTAVEVEGCEGAAILQVGRLLADGLHQVDSPAIDADGRAYLTYSGTRGQQVPVSIFRVSADGTRESFVTGLLNPTGMVFGPDGQLYVSSRFESVVYRVDESGHYAVAASDCGVPCGLAFAPDGALLIGDRSGSILRLLAGGKAVAIAAMPASIAAFHLAMGPDGFLYVTAPTLSARDHVYRVSLEGKVEIAWTGFGRPQGLAFGPDGALYVAEALAGASGIYRLALERDSSPVRVLAGVGLVGLAFEPGGALVVTSNEAAWRVDQLAAAPAR
jgi:sugar lactone lactonase YvrE